VSCEHTIVIENKAAATSYLKSIFLYGFLGAGEDALLSTRWTPEAYVEVFVTATLNYHHSQSS
jgi:hypothetical protein